MKIKVCILVVLTVASLLVSLTAEVRAESTSTREHQIKAAFLYNFIKFVDWPEEKLHDSNEPIIVGIIGKDLFGDAIDIIRGEQVKGRKLVVRWFKSLEESKESNGKDKPSVNEQIKAIRKCHLLFICSSEKKKT